MAFFNLSLMERIECVFFSFFQALKSALDAGKDLGIPDGVLINGKGPFRYNTSLVPTGISYETVNVEPG